MGELATQPAAPAATQAATMTVTVRDRLAERPYGLGAPAPALRTVTISASCPRCGQRRGRPRLSWCGGTSGAPGAYQVSGWTNPCGHPDHYEDVLREAAMLARVVPGKVIAGELLPDG
jgi:hypothetical protein